MRVGHWLLALAGPRFPPSIRAVRELVEECVIFDGAELSCVLAIEVPDPIPPWSLPPERPLVAFVCGEGAVL